jgi:hypothetical protein
LKKEKKEPKFVFTHVKKTTFLLFALICSFGGCWKIRLSKNSQIYPKRLFIFPFKAFFAKRKKVKRNKKWNEIKYSQNNVITLGQTVSNHRNQIIA